MALVQNRCLAWLAELNPIGLSRSLFALYSIVEAARGCREFWKSYCTRLVTGGNFTLSHLRLHVPGQRLLYLCWRGDDRHGRNAEAEDRERYQTLRSIYVAPVDIRFLPGRPRCARAS